MKVARKMLPVTRSCQGRGPIGPENDLDTFRPPESTLSGGRNTQIMWILALAALWVLAGIVVTLVEHLRQATRDKAAREVLGKTFESERERAEILAVNPSLRFIPSGPTRCPACNGVLSVKRGAYGAFWGCNSYPKCHFTRRLR